MSSRTPSESPAAGGRRRFLRTVGAFIGVLAAPRALWARWPGPGPRPDAAALVGCLRARQDAHAVGLVCLRALPGEAETGLLVARLRESLPSCHGSALRRALRDRIRADFAAGRTVAVDGWVLARTEARLCALAALMEVDA